MQHTTIKKFILDIIHKLEGKNIMHFDTHNISNITDTIIICSGISNRHVISISQDILYKLRDMMHFYPHGVEGMQFGEWVLIDLGDIIVHIMQQKTRTLYELEKIWIST